LDAVRLVAAARECHQEQRGQKARIQRAAGSFSGSIPFLLPMLTPRVFRRGEANIRQAVNFIQEPLTVDGFFRSLMGLGASAPPLCTYTVRPVLRFKGNKDWI
jgi:hypothetical protein